MLIRVTMFFETEQDDFHKEIAIEKVLLNATCTPGLVNEIESTLLKCAQNTIDSVRTVVDGFVPTNCPSSNHL